MTIVWIILLLIVLGGFGSLRMAGGSADDPGGAWPQGDDSVVPIRTRPHSMIASQSTAVVMDQFLMPFAGRLVFAEHSGIVALTPTIYLFDDSSTVKELIGVTATYKPLAASAAVARQAIALNLTSTFGAVFKGAILTLQYKTVASESSTDSVLTLWFRPGK